MAERVIELEECKVSFYDDRLVIEKTAEEIEAESIEDLLEGLVCDYGFEWIAPEEIGALTEAPIIGECTAMDEDGALEGDDGIYYWFSLYAVVDPICKLNAGDSLVFHRAKTIYEELADTADVLRRKADDMVNRNACIISITNYSVQVDPLFFTSWKWEPDNICWSGSGSVSAIHMRCGKFSGVLLEDNFDKLDKFGFKSVTHVVHLVEEK